MKSMSQDRIKSIVGFKYIMNQLTIKSLYGMKHYRQVVPYKEHEIEKLNDEFNLLEWFILMIKQQSETVETIEALLRKFKDIETTILNCKKGRTLDLVELYEFKIQAIYMNELINLLNSFNSNPIHLNNAIDIIHILSKNNSEITYDFYLYECYSNELKIIREKKKEIEHNYYRANNYEEQEQLKEIRSNYVRKEDEEELKVRNKLTCKLNKYAELMLENIKQIGHLDYLIAKAKLAIKYNATRPTITKHELVLNDMINPLVRDEVISNGGNYTSNSIYLNQGTTVITGANMSGKSSVLKTVALNAMLAQLGFFVFSVSASIPVVDHVLYVGSETESHKHGLSSFGLEITTLNETINEMKSKKCIICIDEFARSTNPSEGQKFVKAYATYSNTFDSFTLFATHYDGVVDLEMNHYQVAGLKDELINSSDSTTTTLQQIHNYMDYTLKRVNDQKEVPKEAYKVSQLLNIDQEFKSYLDKYYGE